MFHHGSDWQRVGGRFIVLDGALHVFMNGRDHPQELGGGGGWG